MNHLQNYKQNNTSNKDLSFIRPGLTLRVHQKINDGKKTRIQIFEGLVIAQKHGKGLNGMVTIRKIASGVGVERIFPLQSPNIEKFEVVRVAKTRRAKLYYIREKTAKETRKKTKILEEQTKKIQEASLKEESVKEAESQKPEKTNPSDEPELN